MKLWTVTADYFATGEGRHLMAVIGYAEDEKSALKMFGDIYDEYFARGAKAEEGVVENELIQKLFTKEALEYVRKNEGRANLSLSGKLYFNFS